MRFVYVSNKQRVIDNSDVENIPIQQINCTERKNRNPLEIAVTKGAKIKIKAESNDSFDI